eukprot:TRINITY_DN3708_c0_g1_i1.p2 TRINITY_DN3708_c0_g1~~TRINITY_DN3708_c0_g1_i1.p2  ORF type:complete len:129 (-),score=31.90 TRINITY_DN3708_c0_g1_i1:157-543(-)
MKNSQVEIPMKGKKAPEFTNVQAYPIDEVNIETLPTVPPVVVEAPPVGIPIDLNPYERICHNCNKPFDHYALRTGISIPLLVLTIILSCILFPFLFLLICTIGSYKVCPHCRQFAGDPDSLGNCACLC